jgi:hypothetical protein
MQQVFGSGHRPVFAGAYDERAAVGAVGRGRPRIARPVALGMLGALGVAVVVGARAVLAAVRRARRTAQRAAA